VRERAERWRIYEVLAEAVCAVPVHFSAPVPVRATQRGPRGPDAVGVGQSLGTHLIGVGHEDYGNCIVDSVGSRGRAELAYVSKEPQHRAGIHSATVDQQETKNSNADEARLLTPTPASPPQILLRPTSKGLPETTTELVAPLASIPARLKTISVIV